MRKATSCTSRRLLTRSAALLLAAMACPLSSIASGGLVPQFSEDLRPTMIRSSKGTASLALTAFGRDFRLQLSSNERLAHLTAGSSTQFFKGSIEGVPGSWARISIVNDLPRGMVWDGSELFIVDASADAVNYGAAGTVMYKLSDAILERGISFTEDAVDAPAHPAAAYDAMVGELRSRAQALQIGAATEAVEISVLADAAFLARYPGETQARDAILARLNNVDGIFSQQVGIELQVVSVEIGAEATDGLSATTESHGLLVELGRLRERTPTLSSTGLTHLFTGRSLDGDTAGVAYEVALCSRRYAASLTEAHNSTTLDSLITAHEIGHVFGAPHDGTGQCASTPQGQFIMSPSFNTSVTSFSQCSLDQIREVLDSFSCLVTLPPPGPPSPPAPAPPPGGGGGEGDNGGGGGGFDPFLVAFLLAIATWARRPRIFR